MLLSRLLNAIFFLLFLQFSYSQNDCINTIIVCGNTNYTGLSVSGAGTQELFNSNSCGSAENNSLWIKVSIQTGGTLGFTLTPQSGNINED